MLRFLFGVDGRVYGGKESKDKYRVIERLWFFVLRNNLIFKKYLSKDFLDEGVMWNKGIFNF